MADDVDDGEAKRADSADARTLARERQLELAQAITHVGSWEFDCKTGSVTWSDELYRIYGFEPRSFEVTFEVFLGRLHPDDRSRIEHHVRDAMAHGERFEYPERIIRPDGSVRHLETIGEVRRDEQGRPVCLVGTCRDVTDNVSRDETIRLFADIVRNVQIGLAVFEVDDGARAGDARLVAFNPAAELVARTKLGDWVGKTLHEIVPYAKGGELERLVSAVARDGNVHEAAVHRSRDTRDPTRALVMKAFPLPGARVGVAIEDVTAATRASRLRDAEQRVFEMIASGPPLVEVLTELVKAIEENSPGTLVSILLLDRDGQHVRHGAAPSLPHGFNVAIDGAPIGPAAGSCGTAAYRRSPVFVEDVETDPLWIDYRELARQFGLRACWSVPIIATDGRVLGTFALYYREPRKPTEPEVQLITRASRIAGIAIERRQLEDQLRALSAHVESVREEERTGIAREIHDELGQTLTALKMDVAWIGRRVSADAPLAREAVSEKLSSMGHMIDDVIERVRRISAELRPGVLDDLGLVAAIEWQAEQFEGRTGTTCTVECDVDDSQFDRELSTALFRVFQEALTNVARHAEAENVDVRLSTRSGVVRLEVNDDGKGITAEEAHAPHALGLLGIRERARRLGGTAHVEGTVGQGTKLVVEVPLSRVAPLDAPHRLLDGGAA